MIRTLDRLRPLFWGGLLLAAAFGLRVRELLSDGQPWEAAAWGVLGGLLLLVTVLPRRGRPRIVPWSVCITVGVVGYVLWLANLATPFRIAGFTMAACALVALILLPHSRFATRHEDDQAIRLDL